jgi:hypothetical protein
VQFEIKFKFLIINLFCMAYVAEAGVKLLKELKEYQAKVVASHIHDASQLSQTEAQYGTNIMAGTVSGLTSALSSILRYKVKNGEITEKERKEYEKKIDEEAKKPLVDYMKPSKAKVRVKP